VVSGPFFHSCTAYAVTEDGCQPKCHLKMGAHTSPAAQFVTNIAQALHDINYGNYRTTAPESYSLARHYYIVRSR